MKYLRVILIILLLLLLQPAPSDAQDEGTEKKAEWAAYQKEVNAENYAIIIGINEYKHINPQLPSCENDALAMRDKLLEFKWPEDHIFLFLDEEDESDRTWEASRSSLIHIFDKVCDPDNYKDGGTLFIYFSGHGGSVDDDYYLNTLDGWTTNDRVTKETNYNFSALLSRLVLFSNFKRKIVVIDACRTISDRKGKPNNYEALDPDRLGNVSGTVLILSSEGNEPSYSDYKDGLSYFSYHFINSLSDIAPDENGYITIQNAFKDTRNQMQVAFENNLSDHEQKPVMPLDPGQAIPLGWIPGEYGTKPEPMAIITEVEIPEEEPQKVIETEKVATPRIYTWGGSKSISAKGVAIDAKDNVYIVGVLQGTADFDPGPGIVNRTSNGESESYLLKLDSTGTHQWVKTWGGALGDSARGVAFDASGNLYITGNFEGTADLDPGSDTHISTSQGDYDSYLIKLDPSGTFQQAYTWGGISHDSVSGLTVDGSDNVFIVGSFNSSVDLDPGSGIMTFDLQGEDPNTYLSKLDSSGSCLWVKTWDWGGYHYQQFEKPSGAGFIEFLSDSGGPKGVAVDALGNIYIAGDLIGTADLDPGPGIESRTSLENPSYSYQVNFSDACLTMLNASGIFQWDKTWGGISWDCARAVTIDSVGNTYIAGTFRGSANLHLVGEPHNHVSQDGSDAYLIKLDRSGDIGWITTWGGNMANGTAVDSSGNVYVVGGFQGTTDLHPGSKVLNRTSLGSSDAYLIILGSDGNVIWE